MLQSYWIHGLSNSVAALSPHSMAASEAKEEQRNPGKKLFPKGTARRQAPEGSGQATGTPQETQPPAREGAGGTFRELGQDLPHSQPEIDGEEKP